VSRCSPRPTRWRRWSRAGSAAGRRRRRWPSSGAARSSSRTIDSLDALRISVGFFTSDEELDRLAETVELLAAHTPETIPPRRTLTILGNG